MKMKTNSDSVEKLEKTVSKKRLFILAFALVGILAISTACGGSSDSEDSGSNNNADIETIEVSLLDLSPTSMSIEPNEITVKSGTNVVIEATNNGTMTHNLELNPDNKTADLAPFSMGRLELGEITEDTVLICSIPGHEQLGMKMTIIVE